jgi:hypothetical protein
MGHWKKRTYLNENNGCLFGFILVKKAFANIFLKKNDKK